jgi:hypothetical protein
MTAGIAPLVKTISSVSAGTYVVTIVAKSLSTNVNSYIAGTVYVDGVARSVIGSTGWKWTTDPPPNQWNTADYDDSAWYTSAPFCYNNPNWPSNILRQVAMDGSRPVFIGFGACFVPTLYLRFELTVTDPVVGTHSVGFMRATEGTDLVSIDSHTESWSDGQVPKTLSVEGLAAGDYVLAIRVETRSAKGLLGCLLVDGNMISCTGSSGWKASTQVTPGWDTLLYNDANWVDLNTFQPSTDIYQRAAKMSAGGKTPAWTWIDGASIIYVRYMFTIRDAAETQSSSLGEVGVILTAVFVVGCFCSLFFVGIGVLLVIRRQRDKIASVETAPKPLPSPGSDELPLVPDDEEEGIDIVNTSRRQKQKHKS